MHRFLSEQDRPLFTVAAPEFDPAMHPYPDLPSKPMGHREDDGFRFWSQRYRSPSHGDISISHSSSTISDKELSPWSSPDVRAATYSPEAVYAETGLHLSGGYRWYSEHIGHGATHCVTLHDVQQYADAQPEPHVYEEGTMVYGSCAHEGYEPMRDDTHALIQCHPGQQSGNGSPHDAANGNAPQTIRSRAPSTHLLATPISRSKVHKRPSPTKRSSSSRSSGHGVRSAGTSARAFPCPFMPYGCTSTFGSKNEWKRHVHTQHMRLGFWRCDQCPTANRKPNDFNRKDLFIQHVRRMHPVTPEAKKADSKSRPVRVRGGHKEDAEEERILAKTQRRCYREQRSPPAQSRCLFCDQVFAGRNSWEERMEHIGRHMEAAKKDGIVDPSTWLVDVGTEEWLLREGLAAKHTRGLKLL